MNKSMFKDIHARQRATEKIVSETKYNFTKLL